MIKAKNLETALDEKEEDMRIGKLISVGTQVQKTLCIRVTERKTLHINIFVKSGPNKLTRIQRLSPLWL